jgi:hypothetical protein
LALPAPGASLRDDTLKQPEWSTGTNIKKEVASGDIPFDKRYSELTPEQRDQLKSQYERMGPEDEPPFPANGLGPIYKAIAAAQQKLLVEGRAPEPNVISRNGFLLPCSDCSRLSHATTCTHRRGAPGVATPNVGQYRRS